MSGLLVENCIVDASILKTVSGVSCVDGCAGGLVLLSGEVGVLVRLLCAVFRELSDFCGQVFKGTRWMPWHQEPKKDVGICDKPGGVDNRTLIPGCPNGETPPGARVTG